MPYHCDWYLPYRVADARMWGTVSLQEMEDYTNTCVRLLTEAQKHNPGGVVHILLDTREAVSIPPLYLMISQGIRVMKFGNLGTMFLIAENGSTRSVIEVTSRVMRERFPLRIFKERQEALDALVTYLARDARR